MVALCLQVVPGLLMNQQASPIGPKQPEMSLENLKDYVKTHAPQVSQESGGGEKRWYGTWTSPFGKASRLIVVSFSTS